jgi:nucleotide-binding universal stress UspA family protein
LAFIFLHLFAFAPLRLANEVMSIRYAKLRDGEPAGLSDSSLAVFAKMRKISAQFRHVQSDIPDTFTITLIGARHASCRSRLSRCSGGNMKSVKKVLAPTDLSELSCVGLRFAFEAARARSAEVIVYYVIDVGDQWATGSAHKGPVRGLLERHRDMLDAFLRERFPEQMNLVEVRQIVEFGNAGANIVSMAAREAVDRIVMSTHGRTGFDHLLMGSVSEKVIARAPCPVLVIPAHRVPVAEAA